MKSLFNYSIYLLIFLLSQQIAWSQPIVANHLCTDITDIPQQWIDSTKAKLHIAYGHTSHGSQITDGMLGLVAFANGGGKGLSLPNNIFAWNNGGTGGALDLHDYAMGGDVGYYPDWVNNTRSYLGVPNFATGRGTGSNADVNVIIWSWCGQAASQTEQSMIDNYLAPMTQLELDYPNVKFVYMTGHLDRTGITGNLNIRNQQIRDYCEANNKVLFDFADIESYDPDGLVNYMALNATDNCDYDSSGTSINWAVRWQNTHTENIDWYSCSAAHSQSLNGNQKAYAAWWLWAKLAGWSSITSMEEKAKDIPKAFTLSQNYPNPFNPTTTIEFSLDKKSKVLLKVYDLLGHEVATLVDGELHAGILYRVPFNASNLASGVYFYQLKTDHAMQMKKLILMK
jgi:hypothetical protein